MATEWHSIEALKEAFEKTNQLLLKKFNLIFWLKLALVVFLVSGGGGFNLGNYGSNGDDKDFKADISTILPIIIVIFAVLVIIGLVLAFIKAVCQFIFIETVATSTIELIKGFKRNLDSGFNLFLFNLGIFLVTMALLAVIIGPVAYFAITGASVLSNIFLVLFTIIVLFVVMIPIGVISAFTTDFAIVLMHKEKKGIINGWRRLWTLVKNNLKQFLVYIGLKIVLAIVLGIVALVIGLVIFIIAFVFILAVAFVLGLIVFGITAGLGLGTGTLIWLLIPAILLAIAYFIVVSYITVVITLPIPVFFRYYSISFLERTDPGFKVLKEKTPKTKKETAGDKKNSKNLKVY